LNRRTETEMFRDILEILIEQGNQRRSTLLNKTNLNFVRGREILDLMRGFGWIE